MCSISATTDDLAALKEQFLASLNHEMRTPLSGILGMVDLLLETELTGDQRGYLDATRQCANRLLEIMNSALEFSALSAGHVTLEESEFSLTSMLDSALDELALKAHAKGLQFRKDFSAGLPEVIIGDARRLQQVLSLVTANAVKFTSSGEVEVKASARARSNGTVLLKLLVRDTGIGIPEDKLPGIFDSFRQIESGLARRYTGLGLGLAITQKVVALMRGRVEVKSEVGQGTEFTLRIPLRVPAETVARQRIPNARLDSFETRTVQILVIEGNSIARTLLVHSLQRWPYEVDCAVDGSSAVQAARTNQYDLIFVDLELALMDGLDTVAALRKLSGYANTPILALTDRCPDRYREVCVQQGIQGLLSKPVQSSELLRLVEAFLPVSKHGRIFPGNITGIAV